MVVAFSNITIDTSGSTPRDTTNPLYCRDELDRLKSIGVNGGVQADVLYGPNKTVGIIGSRNGVLLTQSVDLFVLPCPPYCHSDPLTGDYTTQNAIAYLSTP